MAETVRVDKFLTGFIECFARSLEELSENAMLDMEGSIITKISGENVIILTTDERDTAKDIMDKLEEANANIENENNEQQESLVIQNAEQELDNRKDELEDDGDDVENNDYIDEVDEEFIEEDGAIGGGNEYND